MTGPAGLPARYPLDGLPSEVRVFEVGARDGLQNEPGFVPTAVKAEFIERLVGAGLRTVEATSFVSPKWIPQLGDAEELYRRLTPHAGVHYPVLVPNQAGLERALACGVADIAVFASATETFSRRNLNRTIEESLAAFAPVVARARAERMGVRGYLSMCFGDPWEGPVPIDAVVQVIRRLVDMGCDEISVGDTIGVATPGHVVALLEALAAAGIGVDRIGVHFHDTYGQALANTIAALRHGVTTVDASAGGLGGCPYAKSATGNLATEDLIWALDGLGVHTGVDLSALVATSVWMAGLLGRPSPSRVVAALGAVPGLEEAGHLDVTAVAWPELSAEHEELRATVARFARTEIAPVIAGYYEREEFPYPIIAAMGEMGLFGLPFPEEYGGMGGDYFALVLVLEELARVDSSVAITLEAAVGLGAMPMFRFGTEEQKQRWLPDLCAGARLAGVRADRAGRRLRRRRHPHPGTPGRRRMGHRRDQRPSSPTPAPTSRPSSRSPP